MKKLFAFCGLMLLSVLSTSVYVGCNKSDGSGDAVSDEKATITYTEDESDFPNPERGFYRFTETRASQYTPLNETQLKQWRGLNTADGGNYQVYSTLVYRSFIIDNYKTAALPETFLQAVNSDFATARKAGVKLITRFVYTTTANAGSCPEGFNCPPYGDASKTMVLQHISQLKPLLTNNADVIAVMQLGLIGTWGENYYSDYFGDPSSNGQGKLLDQNWQDRVEVVTALLNALPKDRMVQVRLPQLKQRVVYGTQASTSVPAMTDAEAFDGSNKSRIGFHNDCFLASVDDYGTFEDYGNSSSPRQSANSVLRNYQKADSKYVAVGGETCDDAYSPQNDCEPAGIAQTQMAEMHYSYLNAAYNNAVNNDWETGGCMAQIKKRLGYRFVLKELTYPKEISKGGAFTVSLKLANTGYASPFNERPVRLVFKNKEDGKVYEHEINEDVRKWYSGDITINPTINLQSSLPAGNYELFLFLPDKYSSISTNPAYAIRMANTNVWDEATGYNRLNASVVVK